MAKALPNGLVMDMAPGSPAAEPELAGVGDRVVLSIDRIAAGGDGVGRAPSGRVVFVPRTAPGDRVEAELVESRPKWARARATRWRERSPERRAAPCPVYEVCGGCRLQHIPMDAQLATKRAIVADALSRIGALSVTVSEPLCGEAELGYRNRVTFTLRREGAEARAGFHRLGSPADLVDVEDCPLAEEPVRDAWKALRAACKDGAVRLPAGRELRLTLRGSVHGEVDLLLEGGRVEHEGALQEILLKIPGLIGCHHRARRGTPRRLAGSRTLLDRWQGFDFELPPGVFLQVNRRVSARMDDWLDERVGAVRGRRILDLYSGVGARAIRWAADGASVAACELQREACEVGRAVAEGNGIRVDWRQGRVEDHVQELMPADVLVVNPPRAGLGRTVTDALADGDGEQLAYVSCDPATLARDLARLSATWMVVEVQPFDAFPQTAHVETVVWMERVRARARSD